MAKYAPANEAGEKPYVVEVASWGRRRASTVYAKDAAAARYKVVGRQRYVNFVRVRRALWGEVPS